MLPLRLRQASGSRWRLGFEASAKARDQAVAIPGRAASPASTSRSAAYAGSSPGAGSGLRPSRSSAMTMRLVHQASQGAQDVAAGDGAAGGDRPRASRPNPPANPASRRRTTGRARPAARGSTRSTPPGSAGGRAPRGPRTAERTGRRAPAAICRGVSVRSQAAASSSASGMPSRRRHIDRPRPRSAREGPDGRGCALQEQGEAVVPLSGAPAIPSPRPRRVAPGWWSAASPRRRTGAAPAPPRPALEELLAVVQATRARRARGTPSATERARTGSTSPAIARAAPGDLGGIPDRRKARPTRRRQGTARPDPRRAGRRAGSCPGRRR